MCNFLKKKNPELTEGEINALKIEVVWFRAEVHPEYETMSDKGIVLPGPEDESKIISNALEMDLATVTKVMNAHDQVLKEYGLLQ